MLKENDYSTSGWAHGHRYEVATYLRSFTEKQVADWCQRYHEIFNASLLNNPDFLNAELKETKTIAGWQTERLMQERQLRIALTLSAFGNTEYARPIMLHKSGRSNVTPPKLCFSNRKAAEEKGNRVGALALPKGTNYSVLGVAPNANMPNVHDIYIRSHGKIVKVENIEQLMSLGCAKILHDGAHFSRMRSSDPGVYLLNSQFTPRQARAYISWAIEAKLFNVPEDVPADGYVTVKADDEDFVEVREFPVPPRRPQFQELVTKMTAAMTEQKPNQYQAQDPNRPNQAVVLDNRDPFVGTLNVSGELVRPANKVSPQEILEKLRAKKMENDPLGRLRGILSSQEAAIVELLTANSKFRDMHPLLQHSLKTIDDDLNKRLAFIKELQKFVHDGTLPTQARLTSQATGT